MKELDRKILVNLTNHALKAAYFIRTKRKEKYYFATHYLPEYFINNFPDASIDNLNTACKYLKSREFIHFCPSTYIKLSVEGANHLEKELTIDSKYHHIDLSDNTCNCNKSKV